MTSGIAHSGNCTFHVDGEAVRSCVITAEKAATESIVTIEDFHPTGNHPLPNAFIMVVEGRTPAALCR
jgi:isoquinoline 1-oxidoreductase alpha subunit